MLQEVTAQLSDSAAETLARMQAKPHPHTIFHPEPSVYPDCALAQDTTLKKPKCTMWNKSAASEESGNQIPPPEQAAPRAQIAAGAAPELSVKRLTVMAAAPAPPT